MELAGKWGYVDRAGDVVVPTQYHIGHMVSERFAAVELDGKWGYIDRSGRVTILAMFDSDMPFCGAVAAVEILQKTGLASHGSRAELYRGKHGMIDHTVNYVWRDAEKQTWPSPFRF